MTIETSAVLPESIADRLRASIILRDRLLEYPERTLPELRRKLTGRDPSSQRRPNPTRATQEARSATFASSQAPFG